MEFNDGALKYRGYSWFSVGLSHSVDNFGALQKLMLYDLWLLGLLRFFKLGLTLFMIEIILQA